MENSPTSSKKRTSKQPVSSLEGEVAQTTFTSSRQRNKYPEPLLNESDQKFFTSLRELDNLLGPNNCSICDRNIFKSVKVRCLECQNPAITMCLECHRTGQEKGDHKKRHDYYILDNLNFPLFTKDWTAKEELMLIQGIMKCGLGNWLDIAEQYVKTKEPQQCNDHYYSFYYKSRYDFLPNQNECIMKGPRIVQNDQISHDLDDEKAAQAQIRVSDYQEKRRVELEAEEKEFLPQQPGAVGDQNQRQGGRQGNTRRDGSAISNVQEVVGYMPKRGDFEQEYDMDADLLLADMEFFDDDTEQDTQLKNDVIELYNARLDERIRRKKFVIERGLLDFKKIQKYERKKTKEEREIINTMKIFARFNTAEDHEKLVNSLIKERLLREVIEQLKYFKSRGLTSLDQIEKFIDTQKKKQNQNNSYNTGYGQGDRANYDVMQDFIKNPSDFMSQRNASVLEHTSLGRKPGQVQTSSRGQAASGSQHIMTYPNWDQLDNKEKELCQDNNIRPDDYLALKRQIVTEVAKNKAINEAWVKEKGQAMVSVRDRVPTIFDFFVKCNIIPQGQERVK